MRPVLFSWHGVRVHSYPALLYIGLVAGAYAGWMVADSRGGDANTVVAATLVLVGPALLGARLAFVGAHWHVYRHELGRILRRSEGGMAMFGGLVLAVALSPPLLALLGLSFMRFWDAAAVTMLVGMIFTRVGCLLHGCCSGRPTMSRFGLRVSDADGHVERRVPTQLLEAISASLILAGAIVVSRRVAFPGSVFLFSLGGYGLARLVLDQTRAERVGRRGPTVAQALSAACVMVALSASAAHLV